MRRTTIFAIAVLLLAATTMSAHAATITVTNTNDSGPGSLRQALTNANNGDRINFAVSGAITLTSGALVVARNVTISGPGANQLSIDGNQGSFVFSVDAIVTIATISGLTIRNGGIGNFGTLTVSNCVLSAAGIFNGGALTVSNCDISGNSGDGIANHAFSSGEARLTLINSNVSDNDSVGISNAAEEFGAVTATIRSTTVSDNSGGGFVATPNGGFGDSVQATITDCTISGNSFWGGIHADGLTNLFVTNSTISGNSANAGFPAGDSGGGIHGANYVLVENSTISGNSAATSGGGIYGGSTIEIVNSTISGNSAGTSGGGIYNFPYSLNVANSTITGNSAPSGGGIYNQRPPVGDSVVEISNTILNAGASGENIFNHGGTITSLGYNLSSDDGGGYLTGPGDQINTDPLLGPLQDNGGPMLTHALLPGSPAIDAGDPNFSPPPFKDQRDCHFDRVFNGRIDIGSFETQPPRRPCLTPRPRPTPPPRP